MAVGVAEEGLLAGRGELDGAAGPQREQTERELEARVLAVGGGARDARDDDLDLLGGQAVAGGGPVAVGVRVGGGDVQLHSPVGARHREPGLRADGRRVLAADAVQPLDDEFAHRLRVAVPQRDVADQVAVGVQRFGLEGLLRVGDRLKDLVLDDDGGGGHARRVGVVGGHGGDGLAVVAYDVGGEDRPVRRPAAVQRVTGHVLVVMTACSPCISRAWLVSMETMRACAYWGPQHRRPQQALGPQVGGVGEGALGLGAALRRRQGRADAVRRHLGARRGHGGGLVAHAWPPSSYAVWWTPPAPGGAWCGMRASSARSSCAAAVSAAADACRSATTSRTASSTPR